MTDSALHFNDGYAVLETLGLSFYSFQYIFRTVLKLTVLIILAIETIDIIARGESHLNISRCLRVVLVIDVYYFKNVRRFFRQILNSFPSILEMLILIIFVVLIFAVLGYALFDDIITESKQDFFDSFVDSFVHLFSLITASTYSEIIAPYYSQKGLPFVFFFFVTLIFFFLMTLLLAVVYEAIRAEDIKKFKKLVKQKRIACDKAFGLLGML